MLELLKSNEKLPRALFRQRRQPLRVASTGVPFAGVEASVPNSATGEIRFGVGRRTFQNVRLESRIVRVAFGNRRQMFDFLRLTFE